MYIGDIFLSLSSGMSVGVINFYKVIKFSQIFVRRVGFILEFICAV